MREDLQNLNLELKGVSTKIDSVPSKIIDPVMTSREIDRKERLILKTTSEKTRSQKQLSEDQEKFSKIKKFLLEFEVDSYKNKEELIETKKKELSILIKEMSNLSDEKSRNVIKQDLLREVPCGNKYPTCRFIKDAHQAIELVQITESKMRENAVKTNTLGSEIVELNPAKVEEHLNKYNLLIQKRDDLANSIADAKLIIERADATLFKEQIELEALKTKRQDYEQNKDAIENLKNLILKKDKLEEECLSKESDIEACENNILKLHQKYGSLEQKLKFANTQLKEKKNLEQDFAAYHLLMTCCHPNGVSYEIIKNRLPFINEEIAKILTNIVEFEVFITNNEDKLDIFIKHPRHDPRPLEMGSGAEKTIASMAIRLAFLTVSSLPKSDLFILDEPGTALDEENMEGFVRILDMIKGHFKTVILISHLDGLKDCVDLQINIEKRSGFASVNI